MHDYLGGKKHDLTVFAVGMPDIEPYQLPQQPHFI